MSEEPIFGICVHCQCPLALFEMEHGNNECLGCRDQREENEKDFDYFDNPAGDDWEIDPDMGCH